MMNPARCVLLGAVFTLVVGATPSPYPVPTGNVPPGMPGSLPPKGTVGEDGIVQNLSSSIRLIRAIGMSLDGVESASCVYFESTGSRQQSDVTLVLSYQTTEGTILGEDELNVPGPFGKPMVAAASSNPIVLPPNCARTIYVGHSGWFTAAVSGVAFPDGSYWHVVPKIPAQFNNNADSGISLTSGFALAGVVPVNASMPNPARANPVPLYECVDITNTGTRPVSQLQVQFAHLSASGSSLAVDTMTIRRVVQPGASLPEWCNAFHGTVDPPVFHYAQSAAMGALDDAPPTIIFNKQRSSLYVWINQVAYTHGAVWKR